MVTFFPKLENEVTPPETGIVSRVLFQDEHTKMVLFGFSAGNEMSEHSAPFPAVMHFLSGEARVTLAEEVKIVGAGAWMHMAPNLPHSITAITPVVMLLILVKSGKVDAS